MCRILESVGETITASVMPIVSYNRGGMFKKKTSQFKTLSRDLVSCDLSFDILDKIIYVFTNNNIDFDISTLNELPNMGNKLLQYVSDSIKKYQESNCEKNINLKSTLLNTINVILEKNYDKIDSNEFNIITKELVQNNTLDELTFKYILEFYNYIESDKFF